jgi:hypothetical protein
MNEQDATKEVNQMVRIGTGATLALMAGSVAAVTLGLIAVKHTVLGIKRGWSDGDKKGSMAQPKADLELIEPHARWLARVLWRNGKWRVLEGRYESRYGRSNARDERAYIVWNPEQYQFSHLKAAVLFAQDFLDGSGEFTDSEFVDASFRKAHLIR